MKVNLNNIVMIEKEVRFPKGSGGDFVDNEIFFVYLGNKEKDVESEYDEYGLKARFGFYLNSRKEATLFFGPHTKDHIDGEIADFNWQLKLKDNTHFKKFMSTVNNSQVEIKELLILERAVNRDMREEAQKYVEDCIYSR